MLFGLGMIVFTQTYLSDKLHKIMEEKGVAIAKRIASECITPVITEQYFKITMMFKDLTVSERDIVYAYVLDGFGRDVANSFDKPVPRALIQAHQVDMGQPYSIERVTTDKGEVLDTAIPLVKGQAGVLHLGISEEGIARDVNTITKAIVVFCLLVLTSGILVSAWYTRNITKPLMDLSEAAEAYGKGEANHYLEVSSKDEVGELARVFNVMMARRRQADQEREQLIKELHQAMREIKTLSGFIPICSSCKKIRDDKGYWNQIESYLKAHSDAEFSHGICPDCARKIYPDLVDEDGNFEGE